MALWSAQDVRRLSARNRALEQENEILRRAAGCLLRRTSAQNDVALRPHT